MANTANATEAKTPPPDHDPEIKSTPNTRGTAVMSEHVSDVGKCEVDDVRPFVRHDVQDHKNCTIDQMLQELLYRCSKQPKSKKKEELFDDTHKYVFGLCDDTMKNAMKQYLTEFANADTESASYKPFVQAANYALLKLSKEKVPGIIDSNGDDEDDATSSQVLLHHNNMPMTQKHQGVESLRKPDVVIVSCETALDAMMEETNGKKESKQKESKQAKPSTQELFSKIACEQPKGRFQWTDVLSTLEFKRTKVIKPPNYEELDTFDTPTERYMKYGKKGDYTLQPESSASVDVPHQRASNEPKHLMQLRSSKGEKKRPSDGQDPSESSSKRVKINNEKGTKAIDPMEQNGLYAAEMFAAHVARQHVLSFLVNNDMIYIWHFDRQDAIQSSGFNFIQDLPRFLMLLLVMQRLPYAEWGHNPLFGPKGKFPERIEVEDKEMGTVDLEIDFHSEERTTHYGLRGRATNVFPVKSEALSRRARGRPSRNKTTKLVAKLYWPEEARDSEAEILEEVHKVATKHPELKDHVPDAIWAHKFEGTATASIRKALGIKNAGMGSRVLYIIIFRKLLPVTELTGDEFLRAWWQAVLCHRILWKHGIRHRDISPSNLMYYLDEYGLVFAVLNDYDLSSLKTTPSGRERTGTVPFMALDLLTEKAIQGKVEHLYQHDAESFIWVLTWISLRYENGKLRTNGRPLDEWLTVDARGCYEKKTAFLFTVRHNDQDLVEILASHQTNWQIALSCLRAFFNSQSSRLDDDSVFRPWLYTQMPSPLRDECPLIRLCLEA